MNDLSISNQSGLINLLHSDSTGVSVPKPFEKDIFLFSTFVAGTTHIEGMEELFEHLEPDEKLELFREPDNIYDSRAIVIKTSDGVKIGYVPRVDNVIFSRLMDGGKLLYAKITDKYMHGKKAEIEIDIYLKD